MPRRVMMVDDNDNDLLFTRLTLQRCGVPCEVVGFTHAQAALDHLRDTPDHGVDLILLDINMPVMNGFDFLEAFEALAPEQRGQTVVALLSSSRDALDRERRLIRRLGTRPPFHQRIPTEFARNDHQGAVQHPPLLQIADQLGNRRIDFRVQPRQRGAQGRGKVQGQLGVELHPVAATLLDMARSLLEHGVAAPAWHKGGAAA